jgi:hypothetical protein
MENVWTRSLVMDGWILDVHRPTVALRRQPPVGPARVAIM